MLHELLLLSLLLGPTDPGKGSIEGVVLNGSANRTPVAGAEVVLRAVSDGKLAPMAETTTDGQGRFSFVQLPIDREIVYLPGANRDGVHYPGKRVRPSRQRPNLHMELIVHDAMMSPCPLVIEQYEIEIRPETGLLRVRETLVIANPTSRTYVGQAARGKVGEDSEPVTLRLAIPADFERITFDKEFFGRRFSVMDATLVTHIPWTPGRKELAFTYLLRNEKKDRLLERPLDLPCSQLRVRVLTDRPEEVSCTLAPDATARSGEAVFKSSEGQTLPAGHLVRVELGRLPVSWTTYARPIAAAALVTLIVAASLMGKRGKQKAERGESRQ